MFDEIKRVCAFVSKEMAKEYCKQAGKEFALEDEDNLPWFTTQSVESLCKENGIIPSFGPIRSGVQIEGEQIEFFAFQQTFSKQAPILSEFVNSVAGGIKIESDGKTVTIRTIGSSHLFEFCSAEYFVGSEKIYAVNSKTGALISFKGRQVGGAQSPAPGEKPTIELNIEHTPTLEGIVHEIIHIKWPEHVSQEKVAHLIIEQMTKAIGDQFNLYAKKPISEIDSLNEEHSQISGLFETFDQALRKMSKEPQN